MPPKASADQKLSKKITKEFTKLVKAFVHDVNKGRTNLAHLIGYLDASTGTASDLRLLPKSQIFDYVDGWHAASEANKPQPKRKNRRGAL